MATAKQRAKRQEKRRFKKHQDPETLDTELNDSDAQDGPLVKEVEEEEIEKDYMYVATPGPTSYSELDAAREAQEKAEQVRRESWTVQDLVYNIAYHPEMSADDKSKAIVQVGKDFGKRLKSIASEPVEKQLDMDVLQLRALLGRDHRQTSIVQKAVEFTAGLFVAPEPDSRRSIRKQLKTVADALEKDPTIAIRNAVPDLIKKAKEAGLGGDPAVMIEKDAAGSWRAVLFPSNNFKDRDGEIIAKSAHEEYVEWVNANMDVAPVFATWHVKGTARTHPMDFIGFDKGFLIESCPLTEEEAGALLKMQETVDIGLSIGGFALERDPMNENVITKYVQVEVSDLPLTRAANPFTDIELVSKEATVKSEEMKKYLTGMLGEERAAAMFDKMALKQEELQKAGVEEKEKKETAPADVTTVINTSATPKMEDIVQKVFEELGVQELSDQFAKVLEKAEKVEVLEELVKQLLSAKEDDLAELINPPIAKQLSWKRERPSQNADNVLKEDNEKDKELKKAAPELGWLSEATHTTPVQA